MRTVLLLVVLVWPIAGFGCNDGCEGPPPAPRETNLLHFGERLPWKIEAGTYNLDGYSLTIPEGSVLKGNYEVRREEDELTQDSRITRSALIWTYEISPADLRVTWTEQSEYEKKFGWRGHDAELHWERVEVELWKGDEVWKGKVNCSCPGEDDDAETRALLVVYCHVTGDGFLPAGPYTTIGPVHQQPRYLAALSLTQ